MGTGRCTHTEWNIMLRMGCWSSNWRIRRTIGQTEKLPDEPPEPRWLGWNVGIGRRYICRQSTGYEGVALSASSPAYLMVDGRIVTNC